MLFFRRYLIPPALGLLLFFLLRFFFSDERPVLNPLLAQMLLLPLLIRVCDDFDDRKKDRAEGKTVFSPGLLLVIGFLLSAGSIVFACFPLRPLMWIPVPFIWFSLALRGTAKSFWKLLLLPVLCLTLLISYYPLGPGSILFVICLSAAGVLYFLFKTGWRKNDSC